MTHKPWRAQDSDGPRAANPVAAVMIHGGMTGALFTLAVLAGLPLAAGAAVAWAGGACATVALLLAHDAALCRDHVAGRSPGKAAPDL
jgi:hypothetical protein